MAYYEQRCYLLVTQDPVHIGTGGYRLGRVDNSIVREPGTRVPKIPGTSLHGAARSYAARLFETPEAAGQTQDNVDRPFENPVCRTFGFIHRSVDQHGNEVRQGNSGVINVSDALILFFPVYSIEGPVWVSTPRRLREAGIPCDLTIRRNRVWLSWQREQPRINLGWLMLEIGGQTTVEMPEAWQTDHWQEIQERIVLVDDAIFSAVVNSNLEVRTSVSINPLTGAAEEGALFTYEAIPRATFLTIDVIVDDYKGDGLFRDRDGHATPFGSWNGPADVWDAGLRMMQWLGVGGMGTRGFGRLAVVADPIIS